MTARVAVARAAVSGNCPAVLAAICHRTRAPTAISPLPCKPAVATATWFTQVPLSKGNPSLLHGHCCRPSPQGHESLQPLRVPLRGRCRLCLLVPPHRHPVLLVVPHEHIYGWRLSAAAVSAAAARLARCLLCAHRCCGAALPS